MFTDTHATVKRLEKAGFSPEQAEALAEEHENMAEEIVKHMQQAFTPQFDTIRVEIAAVRAEMLARFELMEARFNQRLSDGMRELTLKLIPILVGMGSVLLAGVAFVIIRTI